MSLNYLATRFQCSWPWDILVMLCDGRLVCGCADPYGRRVLGDARNATITQVWTGPVITALRHDLNAGGSKFCGDCPLKRPLSRDESPRERPASAGRLPARMFIECTAACNISCTQACCAPETGITRTRQAGMLDFELFRRVIDEAGPALGRIDFFNYGEAFLHKRAVEMCEYIKAHHPHIYLYTSTNGLAFTEAQARRLAHSGIDEVTFSIDGATQESYASTSRWRTCARWWTRNAAPRAICRFSIGGTFSSGGTTAMRK
jgi:MoaA/NifB/PqqE/SkfB family radical SAM enzyme